MKQYRNPVNGRVHREHTWCSQCEQAHPTERWEVGGWFCPAGCGGTGIDALPWEFVQQLNADYPVEPVPGRHYLWRRESTSRAPSRMNTASPQRTSSCVS